MAETGKVVVKDKYGNVTGVRKGDYMGAEEESKINKPPVGGLGALAAANKAKQKSVAVESPVVLKPKE